MRNLKQQVARVLPRFLARAYKVRRDTKALSAVDTLDCQIANLRPRRQVDLTRIFGSTELEANWRTVSRQIAAFAIPDGAGGVNPGDRRAIYYLVSRFQPSSVLEIGSHIGASTLHIAAALAMNQVETGKEACLVSVDVEDVNSPISRPWLKHGAGRSPREMVEGLGYAAFVTFVTAASLDYFSQCKARFDFVFLDGDHAAPTVYRELPAALQLLNYNGVILVHDYFPMLKPLWSNGAVIPGPFLATERLAREGAGVTVLPLGRLPWPTKLESNVTSLALVLRTG